MYRAVCIHCMKPLWFNKSRERWTHRSGLTMCGNGESAMPIEFSITPRPWLINNVVQANATNPHTPGLPL